MIGLGGWSGNRPLICSLFSPFLSLALVSKPREGHAPVEGWEATLLQLHTVPDPCSSVRVTSAILALGVVRAVGGFPEQLSWDSQDS